MSLERVEEKQRVKDKDSPLDLCSLYMDNLLDMSKAETEEQYYRHLLQSVNIGCALLPDSEAQLKERARRTIQSRRMYPANRQMELTEQRYYRLGAKSTGSIIVRPEELQAGATEAINQQCSELTPLLKEIDNRIFHALVDANVIKRKITSIDEMIEQRVKKKLVMQYGNDTRD